MTSKRKRQSRRWIAPVTIAALIASPGALISPAAAAEPAGSIAGSLADGTGYGFIVPENWNGDLIVNPDFIRTAGTLPAVTGMNEWLLNEGYAIGGTSRMPTMDRVQESVAALMQGVDIFEDTWGAANTTVVQGGSLGGFTSRAAIEAHPDRLDGALAMCGGGAGIVGGWNQKLDAAFIASTLLAPDAGLPLVNIEDGAAAGSQWDAFIAEARTTDEGRARLALAAAIGQIATLGDANLPPAGAGDYAAQLDHQLALFTLFVRPQIRATLEEAAGGNPSWNHDVDYAASLDSSGLREIVDYHYDLAGLDLDADLETLAGAERIAADPEAVAWAEDNVVYSGNTGGNPVFTIHTSGDRSESLAFDEAYAETFAAAGNGDLLRQAWVDRLGHCAFTDAERLAALTILLDRIETGEWAETGAEALNARAAEINAATTIDLGSNAPGYFNATPGEFIRQWDARDIGTYEAPSAGQEVQISGVLHEGEIGEVVYEAIKPANWNGTLLLDLDFNTWRADRRDYFLSQGYAIGGNQRTQNATAYELKDYVDNLTTTRDLFIEAVEAAGEDGVPATTIAVGNSRGGFVARMAAQYRADIFDGAIGSAGGGSGVLASTLSKNDAVWALQALVDPDAGLAITNLPDDPSGTYSPATYEQDVILNGLVAEARSTDEGMAKLMLAAAFSQSSYYTSGTVPPAVDDYLTQGERIAAGFAGGNPQFLQKHIEVMGGGPSYFNHGIDYRDMLERSGAKERVQWWFDQAGLDLDEALDTLASAPRLGADPAAIEIVEQTGTYTGAGAPVITIKTWGDPVDPAPLDGAYVDTFEASGNADELLRALLIDGSGHGGHTMAEHVAALNVLEERIQSGTWPETDPDTMNARVAALQANPALGSNPGRYMPFEVTPMLRTWDFTNWGTYRPELSSNLVSGQTVSGVSDVVFSAIDANPVSYSARLLDATGNAVEGIGATIENPLDGQLALENVNFDALAAGTYELVFEATYRNGLVVSLVVDVVRDAAGAATPQPPTMASTGAEIGGAVAVALLLLVAGGAAMFVRRRTV